ncbi:MAG: heme-binding domain-containing protein [Candidatus Binatus sp.]
MRLTFAVLTRHSPGRSYGRAIAWLVCLTLLIVGCSSSRQTTTSEAAVPISTSAVSTDPQVNAILEQSCYQCHSTGGSAPWYAAVSPTYLAANSARGVLNFSDWQTYDTPRKAEALKEIAHSVSVGSMPPGDFTALDHSARLGDDQKQVLLNWAWLPALPAH